jgi:P-type conjugative transfer protein TrbJ
LADQQNSLKNDSQQLERLQSGAQGAQGQMAALGYANQLASNQANQLLQIRGLLVTQQNAVATKMQADADREAQQQAASEALRKGDYKASPARSW